MLAYLHVSAKIKGATQVTCRLCTRRVADKWGQSESATDHSSSSGIAGGQSRRGLARHNPYPAAPNTQPHPLLKIGDFPDPTNPSPRHSALLAATRARARHRWPPASSAAGPTALARAPASSSRGSSPRVRRGRSRRPRAAGARWRRCWWRTAGRSRAG